MRCHTQGPETIDPSSIRQNVYFHCAVICLLRLLTSKDQRGVVSQGLREQFQ